VNPRALFVLLIGLVAVHCYASDSLLTRGEWETNAETVLKLHETNRDDQKFVTQFMAHIVALYLEADKIAKDEGPRIEVARRYVLIHLNARLLFQYAVDHKETVGGDTVIRCRDVVTTTRNALDVIHLPFQVVVAELPNFQRSFGNNPTFRLRSF
jgi:hypothetical protein